MKQIEGKGEKVVEVGDTEKIIIQTYKERL